ncbi:Glutamate receptor ionotropic, delta-2 [Manis javanica]|nr:Glutamate receptor ionotropic, delta-2 [Manis javanica]
MGSEARGFWVWAVRKGSPPPGRQRKGEIHNDHLHRWPDAGCSQDPAPSLGIRS